MFQIPRQAVVAVGGLDMGGIHRDAVREAAIRRVDPEPIADPHPGEGHVRAIIDPVPAEPEGTSGHALGIGQRPRHRGEAGGAPVTHEVDRRALRRDERLCTDGTGHQRGQESGNDESHGFFMQTATGSASLAALAVMSRQPTVDIPSVCVTDGKTAMPRQ